MTISDAVVGNLTMLYLAVIVGIKAYGLVVGGKNFSGAFVLIISTAVVALILIATLTWDVSRKVKATINLATYGENSDRYASCESACRGGICWHGVAVKSPASQLRLRLPNRVIPPTPAVDRP